MKKGIIITIILVVIAVVLAIVFINLFRERDTIEMANRVISAVYDGYLDDAEEEGEYETINEYLDNLIAKESELTQEQRNEVRNFKNVYVTYALIADFYSKQIIFTEYNDVYKEYKSYVMDGLNNSSNSANNMVNYILENSEVVGDSADWTARTWTDVREYAINIVEQTNRAFVGLQNIYTGCVTSKIANNDFATLVLSTINTYLANVAENFSGSSTDIATVNAMVNAYLTENYQDIMNYYYNTELQARVKDINDNGTDSQYYSSLINGTICA